MAYVYNTDTGNWDDIPDEPVYTDPAPEPAPTGPPTSRDDEPPPGADPNWPNGPSAPTGKTPAQIEAEGREYDRIHGLVGGYMMDGVWVNGSPTGSAGGGSDYTTPPAGTGQFDYGPQPTYRGYQSIAPFAFSQGPFKFNEFSYEPFPGSNWNDAEKEPGYAESQERLRKQVEAGAAYQGILRSGMTLGKLDSVLDTNKGQNFAQFDARNFRNYSANRENALGNWKSNLDAALAAWQNNLGMEQYTYGKNFEQNTNQNNYNYNVDNALAQDALARWQTLVNSATTLARPVA